MSHVKLQTLSAFAAQSEDMSVPTSQPSDIVSSVVTADPSPTDSLSAGVIGGVVVLDQGCEKFARIYCRNVYIGYVVGRIPS